jgi:hypothetical protein
MKPDSDGGGCWDGWEVTYGLDPCNPLDDLMDPDMDLWTNHREFLEGTNPRNPNTDNDSFPLDSCDPYPLHYNGPYKGYPGGIPVPGTDTPSGGTVWSPQPPTGDEGNPIGNYKGSEVGDSDFQRERFDGDRSVPERENDHDFDGLVEFIEAL